VNEFIAPGCKRHEWAGPAGCQCDGCQAEWPTWGRVLVDSDERQQFRDSLEAARTLLGSDGPA